MTNSEVSKVKKVEEAFRISYNHQRERLEELWRFYALYHGYSNPSFLDKRRSNPFIMRTFAAVETEVSRFLTALFNSPPLLQLLPQNSRALDTLSKAENTLESYFTKAKIFKVLLKLIKLMNIMDDAFILPAWKNVVRERQTIEKIELFGIPLESRKVKTRVPVYRGLDLKVYSPHQVYPDPYNQEMEDKEYCIIEEWVWKERLQLLKDNYGFKNLDKLETDDDNQIREDPFFKAMEKIGLSQPQGASSKMVRLHHYFTDTEILTVANKKILIREAENDVSYGTIPIVQATKTIDPLSAWGIGLVRPNEKMQKYINMVAKTIFDYNAIIKDPMIFYRGNVDPNLLLTFPGNRIPLSDPHNDVNLWAPQVRPAFAYEMLNFLTQAYDETAGIYGYQRGSQPSAAKETATMGTILSQQGNIRIRSDILSFELMTLVPIGKLCFESIKDNLPEETEVRFVGTEAPQPVSFEDLQIDVDFMCRASSSMLREVDRQQFLQLYSLISQNPILAEPGKQYWLLKRLFEYFEERSFDKIFPEGAPGASPVVPDELTNILQGSALGREMSGGGATMPPQKMGQPASQKEMVDYMASKLRPPAGRTSRTWGVK